MNERQFQSKIVKRLHDEGCYASKWVTTAQIGAPDIIVVIDALAYFLEIKMLKDVPARYSRKVRVTRKQLHELTLLRKAGARALLLVVEYLGPGVASMANVNYTRGEGVPIMVNHEDFYAVSGAYNWGLDNSGNFKDWLRSLK